MFFYHLKWNKNIYVLIVKLIKFKIRIKSRFCYRNILCRPYATCAVFFFLFFPIKCKWLLHTVQISNWQALEAKDDKDLIMRKKTFLRANAPASCCPWASDKTKCGPLQDLFRCHFRIKSTLTFRCTFCTTEGPMCRIRQQGRVCEMLHLDCIECVKNVKCNNTWSWY